MDAPLVPRTTSDKEPAEKYIRTFASDMEAVKKGDVPDPSPPSSASTEPSPVSAHVPKLVQVAIPPKRAEPLPVSTPTKAPSPAQAAQGAKEKNNPLETYSADFSDRVKKTHASTATILAAEQDRRGRIQVFPPPQPSFFAAPYIVGAALLVAGIVGGGIAYTYYWKAAAPVVQPLAPPTPIFVDERLEIAGTGTGLLQTVVQAVTRPLTAGTVRLLYVAGADSADLPQTTVNIFTALPLSTPDALSRNINDASSMAGVINVDGVQSPFFILSVSSYSNVFSSMLAWEPLIPDYFKELFPPYPAPSFATQNGSSASSTAVAGATSTQESPPKPQTSTPPTAAFVSPAVFVDATIANHDARVYRDASGRDILLYGFWDRSTLIIARDTAAFAEIIGRLATARTQ